MVTGSGPNLHERMDTVVLYSAMELARLLRRRPESLEDAVNCHRLFFVVRNGEQLYPAFFVDPNIKRRQVYQVCKQLGGLPGGSKLQFFSTPKGSLGGVTPLAALRGGMFSDVMRCAEGFAER